MQNGTRVELHPATDHWMRGDRYGEIVGVGKFVWYVDRTTGETLRFRPYHVRLDKSGKIVKVHPENLSSVH